MGFPLLSKTSEGHRTSEVLTLADLLARTFTEEPELTFYLCALPPAFPHQKQDGVKNNAIDVSSP